MTDQFKYTWPQFSFGDDKHWSAEGAPEGFVGRCMPEDSADVAKDSRWPAFFPSPICLVTTGDGKTAGLEKVVGPSIVNRFPYIMALSLCREGLSSRHYERRRFMDMLEKNGTLAVQFMAPGEELNTAMNTIASIPDEQVETRIAATGLGTRPAKSNQSPVFKDSYLIYEARLARPAKDFDGRDIFGKPWVDAGSHRIYFLEIEAIQLREDIANVKSQVSWTSLPDWVGNHEIKKDASKQGTADDKYKKKYRAHYRFPSRDTIGFVSDGVEHGMAYKMVPALAASQIETDNDKARWPCFFPSPVAMITSWAEGGVPNLMPCGSTTVVSRHPLVIGTCVCYAAVNDRYAPRASYDIINKTKRFGCAVGYADSAVESAITYSGNISISADPKKIENSGLSVADPADSEYAPVLRELPLHFDCEVVGEIRLGTHVMFLGEVRRILCNKNLNQAGPLQWTPWADIVSADE